MFQKNRLLAQTILVVMHYIFINLESVSEGTELREIFCLMIIVSEVCFSLLLGLDLGISVSYGMVVIRIGT